MGRRKIYLRFGEVPAAGRSECHSLTSGTRFGGGWSEMGEGERSGFLAAGYTVDGGTVYEPGVSAFALDWESDPDDAVLEFDATGSPAADVEFYRDGRPAYLVTGTEVGRGMNDEPLLVDVEVVGGADVVEVRKGLIRVARIEEE